MLLSLQCMEISHASSKVVSWFKCYDSIQCKKLNFKLVSIAKLNSIVELSSVVVCAIRWSWMRKSNCESFDTLGHLGWVESLSRRKWINWRIVVTQAYWFTKVELGFMLYIAQRINVEFNCSSSNWTQLDQLTWVRCGVAMWDQLCAKHLRSSNFCSNGADCKLFTTRMFSQ